MPFLIARDFDRTHAALIEKLRPTTSSLAIGAPMAFGPQFLVDGAIKPVRGDMKVFGPAFTVQLPEPDNLMPSYATKLARPGDVLVIDAGGRMDISVWGNSMALSAMNRKLGGVVVDGAVNDIRLLRGETDYTASEETRRGGILPVFARGPSGSFGGWEKPGSINVPVNFGGRVVEPGDLVIGDADGMSIVPKRYFPEIEDRLAALGKLARELNWHPRIRDGELWFDIISMDPIVALLGIEEVAKAPSSASA
jgi:4-hydroxy-4-methyl-2-oxoglutarate aldolase